MRLSLPHHHVLQVSAAFVAACGALACTPQQVFIEKPCPPVEYPVVNAPLPAVSPSDAAAHRTLDLHLAPTRDDAGQIAAIDVTMRFSVPPVDFGETNPIVLHFASRSATAAMADRIEDLAARDSEGSLALRRVAAAESSKPGAIEWRSERRARGPVTVNYRFELPPADAAPDEFATSAAGILGIGRALFLLPSTTESHTIRIRWDLQALGSDARGFSTFGTEEAVVEEPPSALEGAIWAAGSLHAIAIISTPANTPPGVRFRWITLGKSPFDVLDVAPWANRAWLSARTVASDNPELQFDLFVRPTGKTGQRFDVGVFGRSAIATVDNESTFGWPEKLSVTRAFIRSARGPNLMNVRWFDEGFATYNALETLRRSSLASPADIASELAKRAERYFASPWLRTALATLEAKGNTTAIEHADDRGMLYAAELDAKIRASSSGKRSLEDFLRMVAQQTPTDAASGPQSTGVGATTFRTLLEKELGAEAVSRFADVIEKASATVNIPDDAFGPCFKKVKKKIQREEGESKKRESVDGFTWSLVPKLPPSCANATSTPQVGGLQKTP
ncbi:MAG: hypothetical protein IPM54_08000 [Polyangiaceae bacterium]|nr:hypothetical protein [Polyangiaceae bacterium]